MKKVVFLLSFLFSIININAQDYIHDLKKYIKIADQLGPYPHDLYHYCEELYGDSLLAATTPDGWYWTLVTDGYGSLEKYTVGVKDNSIYELRWEYPHQDTLLLDSSWVLNNLHLYLDLF